MEASFNILFTLGVYYTHESVQPYHFQADLIWCDGTCKDDAKNLQDVQNLSDPEHCFLPMSAPPYKRNVKLAQSSLSLSFSISVGLACEL